MRFEFSGPNAASKLATVLHSLITEKTADGSFERYVVEIFEDASPDTPAFRLEWTSNEKTYLAFGALEPLVKDLLPQDVIVFRADASTGKADDGNDVLERQKACFAALAKRFKTEGQTDLAKLLDISTGQLSRLSNGKAPLTLRTAEHLIHVAKLDRHDELAIGLMEIAQALRIHRVK